jgi:hypothetical protein
MKVRAEFLYFALNRVFLPVSRSGIVGSGSISTRYGADRNIKLIQEALAPVQKQFDEEPLKTHRREYEEWRRFPPDKKTEDPAYDLHPPPATQDDRDSFNSSLALAEELLGMEIEFEGYRFHPDKLVDTFGVAQLDADFALALSELNLLEG